MTRGLEGITVPHNTTKTITVYYMLENGAHGGIKHSVDIQRIIAIP